MTLRELVVAYFQYPAILAYGVLAALGDRTGGMASRRRAGDGPIDRDCGAVYPLVCTSSTAGCLHSRWMFKVPPLAATWKRIHYDHHQDPNHS